MFLAQSFPEFGSDLIAALAHLHCDDLARHGGSGGTAEGVSPKGRPRGNGGSQSRRELGEASKWIERAVAISEKGGGAVNE
jgi:hypothetical protein